MYTIGLTGGIGSGKSYAADIFMGYGIPSIDTDIVAREVCEIGQPCLAEITENFTGCVLNNDGSLNRKALADIVFADKEKLRILNAVTHKYILNECKRWIRQCEKEGYYAALIGAPLLFESKFNYYCDFVISVIADTDVRIKRILQRDGMTENEALRRINNQHDNRFFIYNSDFIINNNPNNNVRLQIDLIYQQLRWV
jgi:dephospho-CoA kinase